MQKSGTIRSCVVLRAEGVLMEARTGHRQVSPGFRADRAPSLFSSRLAVSYPT